MPLQLLAQYNWQTLSNAPASWRYDDVYFINPDIGWAIHGSYYYGAYSSLPTHQYGQVWETRNGGNTWQLRHDSASAFYRCVGFTDSLNGWIGNLADSTITPDTIPFYQTNDGGKTLTPVTLPSPRPKGVCGISVINDSIIYAYGRYFGPAILLKTINKGVTWTTQNMNAYATGLVDAHFFDKDTGFITGCNGNNGLILNTTDGGITWKTVYQGARNDTEIVWKIFFPSRDTGYASIEYVGPNYFANKAYRTYFIKTIDGGKTWTEHPFINNYDEEGIGFINDTVGWIGGSISQDTYITYNGGNTWQKDYGFGTVLSPISNPGFAINRFRKFGDTLMYASGNTEYKLSGKITSVNNLQNNSPLSINYPNPFIEQTTIYYKLTSTCTNVNVYVSNLLGEKVLSQNLGAQYTGEHKFVLDIPLPAGIYYYTIVAGDYTVTRKLVKVN